MQNPTPYELQPRDVIQDPSPYRIRRAFPAVPPEFDEDVSGVVSQEEDPDLWVYWNIVRQHLRLILTLFIVAELLTALVVLTTTPRYTGVSTILIESQMPQVLEDKNQRPDPGYESFYKTQYEILKSRNLAARVIRTLALDKNPLFAAAASKPKARNGTALQLRGLKDVLPENGYGRGTEAGGIKPEIIDAYLQGLKILPEFETRLAKVTFTSPDPALSAKVANAHVQAFIDEGVQRGARSGEATRRFLEGQLAELEKQIEKSETALNDYRRERGVVAFSLDDKDLTVMERMAGLNRALVQAEGARIELQEDVETIDDNDYDSLPAVVSNPLIQSLKIESSRLEGQYANLANEFTPDYPPAAQLHAQLAEVQRRQKQEIKRVVQSIKSKYRAALGSENQLRDDLEREKARVLSLKDASLRDAVLAREVDTNRTLYRSVLERIRVLGMASEARVTNVSVVDTAEIPVRPSSPKKMLSLTLSGFLALMIGVGAAFVMEGSDKRLKTPAEVHRYLQMPSLATILHVSGSDKFGLPPRELLPTSWSNANGVHLAETNGNDETIRARYSDAPVSESFRDIRASILYAISERPPQTILFTSASSGEGKSVTATNTAAAFAGLVNPILLIDADLRRPRCHRLLDQAGQEGLSEVLRGLREVRDVIQPTRVKGLFLLSAGATPPNPGELLASKRMRYVLEFARASFEHILIDSAPILPVSDSVALSRLVDGVVLIAGSRAPKQVVRDACLRLRLVGARVLGVVLNEARREDQRYYSAYSHY